MKAEHAHDHKSDIVSAPGNSPVAGLHLQLAHIITGPRTAPDGGDPFLVYGDVEDQFLLAHQGVYEVVRGERPVNTVALRVIGVHLVATRGEKDLSPTGEEPSGSTRNPTRKASGGRLQSPLGACSGTCPVQGRHPLDLRP
jgi:hypothetical protein